VTSPGRPLVNDGGVTSRPPFDLEECAAGVLAGSRPWVARAITLVESTRADHRALAQELLVRLTPAAGGARRVGITGVPGAGKSTFIDALGSMLTAGGHGGGVGGSGGHKVAVLAVDPSSNRSGGSILGDKTRMARLASDDRAFVRPSPTAGTLGGVAKATREAMVVVEAAGFDVVLVETVGVGQSEVAVADMVDTFLLLSLARTGDQLQGIKKGVLELADVIAVNKADGPHETEAKHAARELAGALRLIHSGGGSPPPVLTCSAREGTGIDEVWARVVGHADALRASGELDARRARQQLGWTWAMVRERLLAELGAHPRVKALTPDVEAKVLAGTLTPALAADELLRAFHSPPD
jgi:LAO/AO transport system kinase